MRLAKLGAREMAHRVREPRAGFRDVQLADGPERAARLGVIQAEAGWAGRAARVRRGQRLLKHEPRATIARRLAIAQPA